MLNTNAFGFLQAASVNEKAKPIYRSVIQIHEEFGSIVDIVRDTGCIQREIADLQQQVCLFFCIFW